MSVRIGIEKAHQVRRDQTHAVRKQLHREESFFSRKRKNYLTAVLKGNSSDMQAIEQNLLQRLKANPVTRKLVEEKRGQENLLKYLRNGFPLSLAVRAELIRVHLSNLTPEERFDPDNPRLRRTEIIRLEKLHVEILISDYRIAFKKLSELGANYKLLHIQNELGRLGRSLQRYEKLVEGFI